jgi:hypothetical protein
MLTDLAVRLLADIIKTQQIGKERKDDGPSVMVYYRPVDLCKVYPPAKAGHVYPKE